MSLRPVLYPQPFETDEVFVDCRRKHQPIHVGNRGDLTVDERHWSAQGFKARSLFAVPRRRRLVVRQDWKRSPNDVPEIGLERRAALPFGKTPTPTGELVPDRGRNCAFGTVLVQALENRPVRSLGDRGRDDARVEKICERQKDTVRPAVLSRAEAAKSSSTPTSRSEWVLRNFL